MLGKVEKNGKLGNIAKAWKKLETFGKVRKI